MTNEEYHRLEAKMKDVFSERDDPDVLMLPRRQLTEIFLRSQEVFDPGYSKRPHRYTRYSPMVYFIRSGDTGHIKIGLSGNPYKRLDQLQTGQHEPLELLLYFPGDKTVEKFIHGICKNLRYGGEWFADHEWLRLLIFRIWLLINGWELKAA